jgi:hypothetical protein
MSPMASLIDPSLDALSFTCPRCATPVAERLYGPCTSCRAELRAKYLGEQREVEVAEYVPKMNVTPNAVALKEND